MRAWLMESYQGVEQLRLAEVADPQPRPGEVVLRIKFAALNPADAFLAQAQYPAKPPLPHVLGRDGEVPGAIKLGEHSGFRETTAADRDFLVDPARFTVAVTDGVVTIQGTPESAELGRNLVTKIRHVIGVVAVRDELTYPPPERSIAGLYF